VPEKVGPGEPVAHAQPSGSGRPNGNKDDRPQQEEPVQSGVKSIQQAVKDPSQIA